MWSKFFRANLFISGLIWAGFFLYRAIEEITLGSFNIEFMIVGMIWMLFMASAIALGLGWLKRDKLAGTDAMIDSKIRVKTRNHSIGEGLLLSLLVLVYFSAGIGATIALVVNLVDYINEQADLRGIYTTVPYLEFVLLFIGALGGLSGSIYTLGLWWNSFKLSKS